MIGYTKPMLRAKAPIVKQDFDFIHETDTGFAFGHVKCPSLSDYDHDDYGDENIDIHLGLERWGDRKIAA